MIGNGKQKEAGRSIFMSSMMGLANTGAVAAAFFITPAIYGSSIDWVQRFTAQSYGTGWEDVVAFIWFALVALLSFFIAWASLATLLVAGGFAVATRFL